MHADHVMGLAPGPCPGVIHGWPSLCDSSLLSPLPPPSPSRLGDEHYNPRQSATKSRVRLCRPIYSLLQGYSILSLYFGRCFAYPSPALPPAATTFKQSAWSDGCSLPRVASSCRQTPPPSRPRPKPPRPLGRSLLRRTRRVPLRLVTATARDAVGGAASEPPPPHDPRRPRAATSSLRSSTRPRSASASQTRMLLRSL
jgi:hypothetical protein